MRVNRNPFIKDSFKILKKVSRDIADDKLVDDWEVIKNTLLMAVGIEKLLKGILYSINPLYVLESPDFKNSANVIYDSNVIDKSELNKSSNEDVIAFNSSVLRCTAFSRSALNHKNTLMKLKNARDIIVHHNLDKLDIPGLKTLLCRDFYPLLKDFSEEHQLGGKLNFFNNLDSKLAEISGALQDDIAEKIRLKIEARQSYWNTLKGTHTYKRAVSELKTVELLNKDFTFPAKCPSCENYAVVFTAPLMEYDSYKNEMVQAGLETKGLKCEFCKLELDDYKELDHLMVKPDTEKKEEVILEYSEDIHDESEEGVN